MKIVFVQEYLSFVTKIGTPQFRRSIIDMLPWKAMHDARDIVDTMHKTSLEIFESEKKALMDGDDVVARQIGQGKDIMSMLSTSIRLHA